VKLTPGKLAGMKAVSNENGVIAAAAMDQRGSLKKALGTRATDEGLAEFKSLVTEVLTQHASAILLDPEWGLEPSKYRAQGSGLLLAYEKTGYDAKATGRLPDLLDLWSVRRLKEAGADCIKILLYYSPFDDAEINSTKHAWIERIGDECRANDIPFFLELIGYKEGLEDKGSEFAALKPKVVADSMREFSKDRYGVDVLKVEIPVNLQYVEGAKSFKGPKVFTKAEALDHYRSATTATNKPFIYLSAGVSNAEFIEDLEFAKEAGVKFNGVLCGRATWKDGIPIFAEKGGKVFETWLKDEGVKNIENVNNALRAATSWYSIYNVSQPALAEE
jgi:tagatose 1,6-diphosphate aldolase